MKISRYAQLLFGVGAGLAIAAPSCVPVSAPSALGSFIACYKEDGGAVRFVNAGDACDPGERQATWNQAGIAGPQGAPGAAGANGNGPAYHHHSGGGPSLPSGSALTLATLSPPAGTYLINFSSSMSRYLNGAPSNNDAVNCTLSDSSGSLQGPTFSVPIEGALISWHTVRTLPGGNVSLACSVANSAVNTYTFFNVDFTATKVTQIIEQ